MALIDTTNPRWMTELNPKNIVKYSDDEIIEVICRLPVALSFIEDQKEEWIRFALQYSEMAISYVKKPTAAHQRLAYESNQRSLSWMKEIDEELALEILQAQPHHIRYIPNPTPIMISVAKIYS